MHPLPWLSRRRLAILGVAALTPLTLAGLVFWRASHARDEASAEIRGRTELPFRIVNVDRTAPSGVETIAATPDFRDLAAYRDTVVVSARSGAFVFDRNGALLHAYRAGFELPGVELAAMSVGVAAGASEAEVFIATRGEGLLAFNGARFRQMLPEDAGLRSVTSVLVLSSGRVLLGTERQGAVVFDGRRLAPFHERLAGTHITALAGSDSDLWIGTLANGLFHYRAGQLEDLGSSLPDPQVLSLAVRGDSAFAGTPVGVVEFRGGTRARTLADGFFARALTATGDTLTIGTEDEGILELPLGSQAHTRPATEGPAAIQRLVTVDGSTYAVGNAAIYRFDASARRWTSVLTAGNAVLADRNIAALAVAGGRLWTGYFDRGLDIVEPGMERATHYEDGALFCINRIVAAPDRERTAVATANGLVLFDRSGRPRQVMTRKDGLLTAHVTDVAFRDGGMVVATPAGLSFVDGAGVRSLYVFHGLVNNHVYTVAARGREVAAGTLGGLSILEGDSVRANYTTANSHLKQNWITALAQVGGDWLAGTYGAGVLRLDQSGEWRGFPDLKDGFIVNANAMAVSGGHVYAGSLDRGLFVFDTGSGRWMNTKLGLPSKNVTALAVDGGYVYVGTDNGLVRIAEGALR